MLDLLRKIKRSAEVQMERFKLAGVYTSRHDNVDLDRHIREAADWIRRGQDHGSNRGVAYGTKFGEEFKESYPETTGYIIPTMLRLAQVTGDDDFRTRALEMGHWECDVQMDCGAVMGGILNDTPTPAIFNTGQVLIGWAALVEELGDERCKEAGLRASRWMLEVQEDDGHWFKGNSEFADAHVTVYNVRAAWGLARFGKAVGEQSFVDAAVKNADYAVSKQAENGWFADNCLTDPNAPLLHTVAYTIRGILEIGLQTERDDLVAAARKAADALLTRIDADGLLPGRWDKDWKGTVSWCCLTGSAQTSIVWSRLYRHTGEEKYRDAARKANRYIMQRHDISSKDDAIRGGLAGSWPTHGDYGRFLVLNWATKFLLDALLDERAISQGTDGDA
jgi:hypothetical protein